MCASCCLYKAKPIRHLMSDLPVCKLAACNKPLKYCGLEYLGPVRYRQNRNECKAWGLLFVCMLTRCIHVQLVTSLDLNIFLLVFSRFSNLREAADAIYSEKASTFSAASDDCLNCSVLRSFIMLCVNLTLFGVRSLPSRPA